VLRKGQRYGTILVGLGLHCPIDLLPDRSAETLVRWLQEHPGAEIISRDCASDYVDGATRGAPEAVQVADRFHLLQNLREPLVRLLEGHHAALRSASEAAQEAIDIQVNANAQTPEPRTGEALAQCEPPTAAAGLETDSGEVVSAVDVMPKTGQRRLDRRARRLAL
jgi:hypothetical protein